MQPSDRIDTTEVIDSVNIQQVIGRYVELTKEGPHFRGLCPFHDERTPSFVVTPNKQMYKCFGCGAGGDVIDFLMRSGKSFHEAVDELRLNHGASAPMPEQRAAKAKPKQPEWQPIAPVPDTAPEPTFNHYDHGQPSRVWKYTDAYGNTVGYVCRFDKEGGKKEVLPYSYSTNGSRSEWRWLGFGRPRPLYNLNSLMEQPSATVIVVEGEKTADATQLLYPHAVVVTWVGGSNSIHQTDWAPLRGRKVVLWPDNDYSHTYGRKHALAGQLMPFHEQPGNAAMLQIAEVLKPHCQVLKWMRNPEGTPCGWDLADADWTPEYAKEYAGKNMIDVPPKPEAQPEPEPPLPPMPDVPDDDFHHTEIEEDHFKMLGYEKSDGGTSFYFFSKSLKAVVRLSSASMTKANFMQLAPLKWWEMNFPGNKGGIQVDAATNWLIQRCTDVGIFNEAHIRGRGAWIDGKDVVVHAGDHLIVNGRSTPLGSYNSKKIYEIGPELGFNTDYPLPVKEANRLMEVVSLLPWERDINSYLLAGWCVVAPVCGALNWRPHIWLTGAAGTGKSWVFLKIVRRLLGETALAVQGETSEAGLRQTLKHDALPIVFDEAEGNERKDQDRIQGVLSLMRSSSATDGGIMAKGSAGGTAKTYRIRSCFAFASIAVQVAQQSDRTRVTILGMKKIKDEEQKATQWKSLQAKYQEIVTEQFAEALRARTIQMLPVILKNADTFSNAAASELGEQRAGDQIGSLLAGAYSLFSNSEITYEKAIEWIRSRDWSEEKGNDTTRDEIALVQHIMEQITKVETSVGQVERTIGELVQIAIHYKTDLGLDTHTTNERLKRLGIKAEPQHVIFSNSSDPIKKFLANTPWARNHNKILLRLDGAEAVDSVRFASGITTRAVKVPVSTIFKYQVEPPKKAAESDW